MKYNSMGSLLGKNDDRDVRSYRCRLSHQGLYQPSL
jgi:hypothetical protein